ncbi:MAG TPA: hypothetical protein PLV00_08140, partial [Caldisericia bacterium]|nr:hypothetical protein [Caldisericia bacterium]
DNKAYAPDKWLYIALGEEHKNSLGKSQEVFLPQSLEINDLKVSVDSINKYVTGILREKETIPDYVIEDMLNP